MVLVSLRTGSLKVLTNLPIAYVGAKQWYKKAVNIRTAVVAEAMSTRAVYSSGVQSNSRIVAMQPNSSFINVHVRVYTFVFTSPWSTAYETTVHKSIIMMI